MFRCASLHEPKPRGRLDRFFLIGSRDWDTLLQWRPVLRCKLRAQPYADRTDVPSTPLQNVRQ